MPTQPAPPPPEKRLALLFAGGGENLLGGGTRGRVASSPRSCPGGLQRVSRNACLPRATLPLLLFQKTEIYSVELSGPKALENPDEGGGKKCKGQKNNLLELKKKPQKEEPKKELDLVSASLPKPSGCLGALPSRGSCPQAHLL